MAINRALSGRGGAGSAAFGTSRMSVTIMGVEPESSRIMVRDSFGNEFFIDGSLRAKGVGMPAMGERWVLAKIGGKWTLDLQIGAINPPVIEGDRGGLNPVLKQMLDAMAAHGLVVDLTVDSDPDEVEYDDTTDPAVLDPEAEPYWGPETGEDEPIDGVPLAPPVPPGSTVNDDALPGSKISSDLFTAVSYNLVYSLGTQRAKQDLNRLYKFADVIGLQECVHAHRAEALAARDTDLWGMYRPAGGGIGNVILWRKDVFKRLDEGTHQLSAFDGPGTLRPARAINWVRLEHRPTGVVYTFANFHWENAAAKGGFFDPTYRPSAPRHIERFKEQIVGIQPVMADLTKRGPVLFVGDFNVRSPDDLRLRNPGLPTAVLGRYGLRSNWDILGQPSVGTSVGSNTVIDWMMLSNTVPGQMKFVSSKVLRGYRSDHRPVVSKIRIKNFA